VIDGRLTVPADRLVISFPFGLGVLELAVGNFVHHQAARLGELHVVDHFFADLDRYG
jgi:hypothetical protein